MILPPQLIRRFRSVVKKCLVRPSRTPGLNVLVHSDGQSLRLFADLGEIAVELRVPQRGCLRVDWSDNRTR